MWKSTLIGEALKAFKYCIYNILCSGNVWRSFLKPFCVLWSLETWFETHMCFFKKFLNICPLAVCFLLSTFSPIQVNLSNFDMVMESDLGTFSPVALQFTGSVAAQKVRSLHGNHRSIFIYSEHCNSVYPGKHWVLKKNQDSMKSMNLCLFLSANCILVVVWRAEETMSVCVPTGDGGGGQTVSSSQYHKTGGKWGGDGHLSLDAGRSTRSV